MYFLVLINSVRPNALKSLPAIVNSQLNRIYCARFSEAEDRGDRCDSILSIPIEIVTRFQYIR